MQQLVALFHQAGKSAFRDSVTFQKHFLVLFVQSGKFFFHLGADDKRFGVFFLRFFCTASTNLLEGLPMSASAMFAA